MKRNFSSAVLPVMVAAAADSRGRCCSAARTGPTGAARREPVSRPKRACPTTWSPAGENLAWRVPYGGRSVAGRLRRPPLPAEHVRHRRSDAGAADVLQRRHRQAAVGAPLQPVHQRRAAASHRLVVARRRSGDRQRVRDQRRRPADVASRRTASCSGSAPSPKSSACGRRTAGACRRRSSTATR